MTILQLGEIQFNIHMTESNNMLLFTFMWHRNPYQISDWHISKPMPCVLVNYCYIIKHSQTQWLKTTIYAAHKSVCWQFSLDLAV